MNDHGILNNNHSEQGVKELSRKGRNVSRKSQEGALAMARVQKKIRPTSAVKRPG
jgi:hypothetical protein